MTEQAGAFTYSFDKNYYENFISNRVKGLSTNGDASYLFNDEGDDSRKIWYDSQIGANTTVIDGVTVDNGLNLKGYINAVYNGDQPVCLIDKMAREIGNATAKIIDPLGIGFGCIISQVIFDIVDSFTDVFGSFICTATLEDTECGDRVLNELKRYRDEEVLTSHEGMRIVRYYEVLGPKIVQAIDSDPDKELVYKYILADYVLPLSELVRAEKGSGVRVQIFSVYFKLMDDMVKRYDIRVGKQFSKWKEEYS